MLASIQKVYERESFDGGVGDGGGARAFGGHERDVAEARDGVGVRLEHGLQLFKLLLFRDEDRLRLALEPCKLDLLARRHAFRRVDERLGLAVRAGRHEHEPLARLPSERPGLDVDEHAHTCPHHLVLRNLVPHAGHHLALLARPLAHVDLLAPQRLRVGMRPHLCDDARDDFELAHVHILLRLGRLLRRELLRLFALLFRLLRRLVVSRPAVRPARLLALALALAPAPALACRPPPAPVPCSPQRRRCRPGDQPRPPREQTRIARSPHRSSFLSRPPLLRRRCRGEPFFARSRAVRAKGPSCSPERERGAKSRGEGEPPSAQGSSVRARAPRGGPPSQRESSAETPPECARRRRAQQTMRSPPRAERRQLSTARTLFQSAASAPKERPVQSRERRRTRRGWRVRRRPSARAPWHTPARRAVRSCGASRRTAFAAARALRAAKTCRSAGRAPATARTSALAHSASWPPPTSPRPTRRARAT
mmetsp:Transcript_22031/g.71240  ORF Transcript_22031/g.71240 Transcript_22031/m.71240 type:complete len:481 (+) Transcript_22031:56-1498(+)